ncbi:hypothetical protein DESC_740156 [Desulfosarcina cetonica]|uniref:hypothetical protein n=1 Tax=Desulfosarcina cetonica TaxID=90730 RepID=UPI0006D2BE04|nr:hypothetical protein [Desulfosarcina cetonica]VTR69417.1 hypothetical protein DESC_740156 [Desulfosarcina cetonica]
MNFSNPIRQHLLYKSALKKRRGRIATESLTVIDRMIETFGNKIPYLASYRSELTPLIHRTNRYLGKLIDLIPGPVVLDPARWDRDPVIHSIFESENRTSALLSESKPLTQFFRHSAANVAFALLTTEKKEKSVFVSEKDGEIFRRDVLKKAVFFENHQVTRPSDNLTETRVQVRYQLFSDLFAMAAETISALKESRAQLEAQRDEAAAKMALYPAGSDKKAAFDALHQKIEGEIKSIEKSLKSPKDYVAQVQSLLQKPEHRLSAQSVAFRLNEMGIRLDTASAEPANEFSLAEFEINNGKKWMATWVRVDRSFLMNS